MRMRWNSDREQAEDNLNSNPIRVSFCMIQSLALRQANSRY